MVSYITRRLLIMIPMMLAISILCFTVVKLEPGSYVSQYLENPRVSPQTVLQLKKNLGLDKPAVIQYFMWLGNAIRGNFGYSFAYQVPVSTLIWQRMGWTIVVSLFSMLFTWLIAIPLGMYSATHQYSVGDYLATVTGYIGLSIPDFFFAIILMYFMLKAGSSSIGGLFSQQFIGAPWSLAKFIDMLKHIWLPTVVIGTAGIAGIMRIMRNNMLEVINSPMIISLRARGLSEKTIMRKHAFKNAINPMITIAGMSLPGLFSGTIIVSIILNIPTMGPFFYNALLNHDEYLVMAFLLLLGLLLQLGNLIADILLAAVDPRIRYT
jgi:peptide/nickel transport system permease protein